MTPNHSLINRLPEEVWDIVLDYVELKDLRKVARVNTMFAKHARSGHPDSHPPYTVIEVGPHHPTCHKVPSGQEGCRSDSDDYYLIEDYDSDDYYWDLFGGA